MKLKTVVDWCAQSDMMIVSFVEVKEYAFDFDATRDALNLMQELRLKVAGDAGCGWNLLYRAMLVLEADCANYFSGK